MLIDWEGERIKNKLKKDERIGLRPVGEISIPTGISQAMKETVGFAEPEECGMFSLVEYEDPYKLLNEVIDKPTIWDEGKKSLELIVGSRRTEELTIDEFSARKRITKSLIKLIKNALVRMKILVAVDYYEIHKKRRSYFKKRLEIRKLENFNDMIDSLPDEKQLQLNAIMKQRTKYFDLANKRLDEEKELVKQMKSKYLTNCFEYQMNWILLNQENFYQRSINKYSLNWRLKLNAMKDEVKITKKVPICKDTDMGFLENLTNEINREWEKQIYNSQEALYDKLKNVSKDILYYKKLILTEKTKRKNILAAIEKSNNIVESIISQFEKLVSYSFKGKPGEANFFLSYRKLKEFNKYLCDKVRLESKRENQKRDKKYVTGAVSSEATLANDTEDNLLKREDASEDIHQFKNCLDMVKVAKFRQEVLRIKEIAEEIRCVAINKQEELVETLKSIHSTQIKPVTGLVIRGDVVGNPNPISNIRPITFHIPLNETTLEKEFRIKREQVLGWHEVFWHHHNAKFIKERKEFIENVQKTKNLDTPLTADEMSVFYKAFLDKYWRTHIWYNIEWYKKNISLLLLAFKVEIDRYRRKFLE